jgi:hypothetical protein
VPSITFFETVTEQLNVKNLSKGDAISFLQDSFRENFPNLKIIPTTAAEINNIIYSLKPKYFLSGIETDEFHEMQRIINLVNKTSL